MIQSTGSPRYEIERLAHTTGLRVWVNDHSEYPEAAAQLLQAANRLDIVPFVMLFDVGEDSHALVLLADD